MMLRECRRCGHEWLPRYKRARSGHLEQATPKRCPACNSLRWNVEPSREELLAMKLRGERAAALLKLHSPRVEETKK